MKVFKGFNKDMTCRGFQYEQGGSYTEETASLCNTGFHACEAPLDCFRYYGPAASVYHEAELEDVSEEKSNDSKRVGKKIRIGARLSIGDLAKAQMEFVKEHCAEAIEAGTAERATAGDHGAATAGDHGAATAGDHGAATAGDHGAATAGYHGAATAGYHGAATAGYHGAATAGDHGAATAGEAGAATAGEAGAATAGQYGAATSRGESASGDNGLSVARGNNVKVKGGLGAVLVIAEENLQSYDLDRWGACVVDGEKIKPDTWYRLNKAGEFEELA